MHLRTKAKSIKKLFSMRSTTRIESLISSAFRRMRAIEEIWIVKEDLRFRKKEKGISMEISQGLLPKAFKTGTEQRSITDLLLDSVKVSSRE